MNVLIVGCGNVGLSLAKAWRKRGFQVWGTTTTPAKLESLEKELDRAFVCQGNDKEQLEELTKQVDLVVVSVAPPLKKSLTPEQRQEIYKMT